MRADFWQCPSPGWFLQWAVERAARPGISVAVVSPSVGALCGFVPNEARSRVTLVADDAVCGIRGG